MNSFYVQIQKRMLEIGGDVKFPKSEKVNVQTMAGNVTFRTLISSNTYNFLRPKVFMKIGSMGISGVTLFDKKVETNLENFKVIFNSYINRLESNMDVVKRKSKGKIVDFSE